MASDHRFEVKGSELNLNTKKKFFNPEYVRMGEENSCLDILNVSFKSKKALTDSLDNQSRLFLDDSLKIFGKPAE